MLADYVISRNKEDLLKLFFSQLKINERNWMLDEEMEEEWFALF